MMSRRSNAKRGRVDSRRNQNSWRMGSVLPPSCPSHQSCPAKAAHNYSVVNDMARVLQWSMVQFCNIQCHHAATTMEDNNGQCVLGKGGVVVLSPKSFASSKANAVLLHCDSSLLSQFLSHRRAQNSWAVIQYV